MRKIVATEYVTLDGVMHEPGEWSGPFFNDEAVKFKYDELFASDALLLGRVTYEGFAKAWPAMEGTGDFGERMNGMPKYVVSTTLRNPEWNNSHVIGQNVVEEIAKLKQGPGQDILLSGSGKLLHTLMEHDLVDEYRLMLHPIVLGGGKRLFENETQARTLKLVEAKPLTTGIVILTYLPAERE
jgi:dihydrofolate reductase